VDCVRDAEAMGQRRTVFVIPLKHLCGIDVTKAKRERGFIAFFLAENPLRKHPKHVE